MDVTTIYYRSVQEVLNRYRKRARKKGLSFTIGRYEFFTLLLQDCYYCGVSPSNSVSKFNYNGLDRIDSSKGYEVGNVVPCCKWCNSAKLERSQEEFAQWTEMLYNKFVKEKRPSKKKDVNVTEES